MASLPGTSNSGAPLNTDHERGGTKGEITTSVETSKEYFEEDLVSLLVSSSLVLSTQITSYNISTVVTIKTYLCSPFNIMYAYRISICSSFVFRYVGM